MTGSLSRMLNCILLLAASYLLPDSRMASVQGASFEDAVAAVDVSPFDPAATLSAEYLLNIVEHGTQEQKIDLARAVQERNGSIDWLHLLLYDSSDARFAALVGLSQNGTVDSVPHLLNYIEKSYEEANYGEVLSHVDLRPFKYQEMAVATVEKLLAEPILEPGSVASGASRKFGDFAHSHGYREEMKAAVLKAELLLEGRDNGSGLVEHRDAEDAAFFPSETATISGEAKDVSGVAPLRLGEKVEEGNRGIHSAFLYLLLAGLLVGVGVLAKIMWR